MAGPCITAFRGDYFEQIDTLSYVEKKYDIDLDKRWEAALYLFILCIGVQSLHCIAGKYINTVNR